MAKIETITPVHIGDGNNFFAIKKDGYMYSLDEILERFQPKYESIQKLTTLKNQSSEDLVKTLAIPSAFFESKYAISQNLDYGKHAKGKGTTSCCQKTLGKPIIPGSSLKGAFINVFWYHIIKNNSRIKDYFINSKNKVSLLEDATKVLRSFLMVRDANFDCETVIYEIKEYNPKQQSNGKSYIGNVETINKEKIFEGEILIDLNYEKHKYLLKNLKIKLIEEQNGSIIREFINEFINELYNYVIDFKTIFPQYNKEFMKEVINRELNCAYKFAHDKIDINNLKQFYEDVLKKLNNGDIIMQIGKYTNYVDKSFIVSLSDHYTKNFDINTLKLTTINGIGKYPLGFIKLEL